MVLTAASLIILLSFLDPISAQDVDEYNNLLIKSNELFLIGDYNNAITILDEMLEIDPVDSTAFEMKGLAYSNLRLQSTLASQPQEKSSLGNPSILNKLSMLEFYKALEINPNSVLALNGMALGFGNFGEYSEAEIYFKKSLKVDPDNKVTQNYLDSLERLKKKYSLHVFENPTKKPDFLAKLEENTIPYWIKNNAGWWSKNKISDDEFISGIEYLIKNKIINVNSKNNQKDPVNTIPDWIKNNAGWWSKNKISDDDFIVGIEYLIENNIIEINVKMDSELLQKDLERKAWNFEQYINNIQNDIKKQNRYVENINPSEYVIIKYWKDYEKWNFEQFLHRPDTFPDTVWYVDSDGNYIIEYKIYINEQPQGLPIDHVSTIIDSFSFWSDQKFDTTDGKTATINFTTTPLKGEANVWITWVVRNLGEGVLGHANLGKGVVEVAIGGYGCDGTFQLFNTETVQYVMNHELGHSLGFGHSDNPDKIMYPSIAYVGYEYCLLN